MQFCQLSQKLHCTRHIFKKKLSRSKPFSTSIIIYNILNSISPNAINYHSSPHFTALWTKSASFRDSNASQPVCDVTRDLTTSLVFYVTQDWHPTCARITFKHYKTHLDDFRSPLKRSPNYKFSPSVDRVLDRVHFPSHSAHLQTSSS